MRPQNWLVCLITTINAACPPQAPLPPLSIVSEGRSLVVEVRPGEPAVAAARRICQAERCPPVVEAALLLQILIRRGNPMSARDYPANSSQDFLNAQHGQTGVPFWMTGLRSGEFDDIVLRGGVIADGKHSQLPLVAMRNLSTFTLWLHATHDMDCEDGREAHLICRSDGWHYSLLALEETLNVTIRDGFSVMLKHLQAAIKSSEAATQTGLSQIIEDAHLQVLASSRMFTLALNIAKATREQLSSQLPEPRRPFCTNSTHVDARAHPRLPLGVNFVLHLEAAWITKGSFQMQAPFGDFDPRIAHTDSGGTLRAKAHLLVLSTVMNTAWASLASVVAAIDALPHGMRVDVHIVSGSLTEEMVDNMFEEVVGALELTSFPRVSIQSHCQFFNANLSEIDIDDAWSHVRTVAATLPIERRTLRIVAPLNSILSPHAARTALQATTAHPSGLLLLGPGSSMRLAPFAGESGLELDSWYCQHAAVDGRIAGLAWVQDTSVLEPPVPSPDRACTIARPALASGSFLPTLDNVDWHDYAAGMILAREALSAINDPDEAPQVQAIGRLHAAARFRARQRLEEFLLIDPLQVQNSSQGSTHDAF